MKEKVMKDHDYVNFSEEHELNYQLRKVEKSQSRKNREELVAMGGELKEETGKTHLKHGEFHDYVKKNLKRLDD